MDALVDARSPEAVLRPGADGDLLDDVNSVRGLGGLAGESYVDKDLRTLLGDHVNGRFNLSYCGEGSLKRVPRLALVHAARGRRPAGGAVRQPRSDHVAEDGQPHRVPAGADPEHDAHDQPADVPAGARVPAPVVARALGVLEPVEVELEPGEAAAGGGGLATAAVR